MLLILGKTYVQCQYVFAKGLASVLGWGDRVIPNQPIVTANPGPHPQPFSLGEKGARFKVPLPSGEGFRVRANCCKQSLIWYELVLAIAKPWSPYSSVSGRIGESSPPLPCVLCRQQRRIIARSSLMCCNNMPMHRSMGRFRLFLFWIRLAITISS
jgi:hypothetical protein